MEFIFGLCAMLGAILFLGAACMMHGFGRGYEKGVFDAERWWVEQGAEIERERAKVWREEGIR